MPKQYHARLTSAAVCCVPAAEELQQLDQEMLSWGIVPRPVSDKLTPAKALKHLESMLMRDFRMRLFWPQDSKDGAMYLCSQGHADIDLADYNSGSAFLVCICLLQVYRHF